MRDRHAAPMEMPCPRGPPQNEQPDHDEDVGGAVQDPVPERIELEVLDGVDGVPAAEHVVRLEHLMREDAVEEAAEPEQDPAEIGKCPSLR